MNTAQEATREQIISDMMAQERHQRIMSAQYAITHRRKMTLKGALLESSALNSGYLPCHRIFMFCGAPKPAAKE